MLFVCLLSIPPFTLLLHRHLMSLQAVDPLLYLQKLDLCHGDHFHHTASTHGSWRWLNVSLNAGATNSTEEQETVPNGSAPLSAVHSHIIQREEKKKKKKGRESFLSIAEKPDRKGRHEASAFYWGAARAISCSVFVSVCMWACA